MNNPVPVDTRAGLYDAAAIETSYNIGISKFSLVLIYDIGMEKLHLEHE